MGPSSGQGRKAADGTTGPNDLKTVGGMMPLAAPGKQQISKRTFGTRTGLIRALEMALETVATYGLEEAKPNQR